MAPTWPDGRSVPADHDARIIASRIERRYYPRWLILWGEYTKRFWAMNAWHVDAIALIPGRDEAELLDQMSRFEQQYPRVWRG
jgi:hypothetical protein